MGGRAGEGDRGVDGCLFAAASGRRGVGGGKGIFMEIDESVGGWVGGLRVTAEYGNAFLGVAPYCLGADHSVPQSRELLVIILT